jgi:hypothetical protein
VGCAGLNAAVRHARPGETVRLPAGICRVNLVVTNTAAFTLEGTSGAKTVLRPALVGQPIVASNANVRFTLRGLRLTGATQQPAVLLQGSGEAVTISGNLFVGNRYPGGPGAAISLHTYLSTTHQPTVITGNVFKGNAADEGGAVAAVNSPQALTVSNNTFTANSTGSASNGGAIYIASNRSTTAPVVIDANRFGARGLPGNTARDRGGAAVFLLGSHQPLRLHGNLFDGNRLAGDHTAGPGSPRQGGAVFVGAEVTGATFRVKQSANRFIDNAVEVTQSTPSPLRPAGGGAEWIVGVTVSSTRDVFTGNRVTVNDGQPPEGGAVGITSTVATSSLPARGASLTASDDLLQSNSVAARGLGGGLYTGSGGALVLDDTTVVGNRVGGSRGAVSGSAGDRFTARNSIVGGRVVGFGAGGVVVRFSDLCPRAAGRGNICASPRLSASGAETAASPTIDAGSNALVPPGLHTDLLGHPRISAGRRSCHGKARRIVDLGAFEFIKKLPRACRSRHR